MSFPILTSEPGALETSAMISRGEMSPSEAVDAAIARIEELDAHINAVVVCDFERAIATAKTMTKAGPKAGQPLFGVPMTIKESFDIEGLPTTWGHETYQDHVAKADSRVVRLLKQAGVVFLGKTNVPPDLADWQSSNPVYGRTHNPHEHDRSPGGSSGGSAAAVASGMVPCEFGTDIGGSVRVPAHFCGVWAHKSSWGLISKEGHDHPATEGRGAHDQALSIAGPLARNAADLAALLRITANMPLSERARPLRSSRILMLAEHPTCPTDSTIHALLDNVARVLESAGVTVDRASDLVPDLESQHASYMRMLNIAMARGAPNREGKRASATDWFDLLDIQARNEMAWARLFETYDFVLAPPAPVLAVPNSRSRIFDSEIWIEGQAVPGAAGLCWSGLVTFPNLPATVLPIGGHGVLPCGMQVIGPRWRDLACIEAAEEIGRLLHS